MINLDTLNEQQKEAVLCDKNRIMVLAGAGSGKTTVLTTRIAYLIQNDICPSNILALTFTNKAANEMKVRIEKATGIDRKEIQAMTFHSFAVRVLRKHIYTLNLGYSNNFKIYDDEDCKKIMFKVFDKYNIDSKNFLDYMNKRKLFIQGEKISQNYEQVIIDFQKQALKDNAITFDDMMIYLYKVLLNSQILSLYQEEFEHILVDEFQDTDDLQYAILKMLSKKHKRLFVVGDDSQTIYSFRCDRIGSIMQKYLDDFLEAKLIKLEQNYRSTPEILSLANQVIAKNNQIPKKLWTKNSHGIVPGYTKVLNQTRESERTINLIKQMHRDGFEYKDIAILYRMNVLSRQFEEELIKNRIPYCIYNGTSFYQREEIKDIICYLRVIADDYDNFAFSRIINKPRRKIGKTAISEIEQKAIELDGKDKYSLLNACQYFNKSKQFYDVIINVRRRYLNHEINTINLMDTILYELLYIDYLATLKSSSSNNRTQNVLELKTIIRDFERNYHFESNPNTLDFLCEFLQQIFLVSNEESNENKDVVKLMTIHSAKGLEFEVVFLPALEEGIFPNYKATTDEDIEEERRLFYVAITRAKKKLFLTSSYNRFLYGENMTEEISRFLKEAKGKIQVNY